LVSFDPFLTDATEPVPPPLDLQGTLNSGNINLTWSPIPATLETYTYQVNYSNLPGPPYDGTGSPEGNSPIDVGSVTSFTLTNVDTMPYFITITAKDSDGNLSWYSNEVNNFMKYYLPVINVEYQATQ
jgi:hypothetical protein